MNHLMLSLMNLKLALPLLLSFIAAILLTLLAYYVPVHEWDESRNGINAIEMLGNGDWLNLHYAGKVDTWNAKPPLLIWCIALSFKIFGISVFALRIPSIICGALFIYFFYLTSRLFIKPSITIAITIGLIFTKIFYLDHIGFTADFDGMLNLIIIMATYFYFKFILTQQSKFLHFASFMLGLGFWVKGPAVILFCIPVLIHYLISTYESFNLKRSLSALGWFLILPLLWISLIVLFGKPHDGGFYGQSGNAIQTLLFNDLVGRALDSDFPNAQPVWYQFFSFVNIYFQLFEAIIYICLGYLIFMYYKSGKTIPTFYLFSGIVFIIYMICISLMKETHSWYIAPISASVFWILSMVFNWGKSRWRYAIFYILIAINFGDFLMNSRIMKEINGPEQKFFETVSTLDSITFLPYFSQRIFFIARSNHTPIDFFYHPGDEHVICSIKHFEKFVEQFPSLCDMHIIATGKDYLLLDH